MRRAAAVGLALIAAIAAVVHARRVWSWNDDLAIESPLAHVAPIVVDPQTRRLAGRVVLVIVDGLRADESHLPFLDELRHRGIDAVARVPYPTVSRPNYVTILTGVPPRDSGVRSNHVIAPVVVDTVMDRVRTAGERVAVATDFGILASLFLRDTPRIDNVAYLERGTRVRPPPPITWPVDEAHRAATLDEVGPTVAALAAGDAAFIAVHVIDVDRAGHAAGVGTDYRAAAAAVDRMLRVAFARIDLARDAVIVTADHGHVSPGGHGGTEPEVAIVPLVIAGSGIVPGAIAHDAALIDLAPTVAALLGVAAPGHAEGRTLVELLALTPEEAARRTATDDARVRAVAAIVDTARASVTIPEPWPLALTAVGLVCAIGVGFALRRRRALDVPAGPRTLASVVALIAVPLAIVAITRGHASPSYIPSQARTEQLGALGAALAIALQVIASRSVVRRAPDRLAAATGLSLVGLTTALVIAGVARAWFSPPFLDVPSPFWMVAVPTLELATAACAVATALTLAVTLSRASR